jgi:stearoyl-CoA desaturase (delta-9 desaturase)
VTALPLKMLRATMGWLDSHTDPFANLDQLPPERAARKIAASKKVSWLRALPFISLHVACLGVFWTGWSWFALAFAAAAYLVRMHAITGWYHRYFSHRTFRTNRVWQFVWAVIGNSTFQRGPLWWAAHHRHHHRHSDGPEDTHSPQRLGFWYSHSGWFFVPVNYRTRMDLVPDLARHRELVWLDRVDYAAPVLLLGATWLIGLACQHWLPFLRTGPWQLTAWYLVSTIAVAHATFTINSCAHLVGGRRYDTDDDSRNHFGFALLTLGEGWHNNHHHYQSSAKQGFFWWQIDISYYLLWLQRCCGLVSDLKGVPEKVRRPGAAARPATAELPMVAGLTPAPAMATAGMGSGSRHPRLTRRA